MKFNSYHFTGETLRDGQPVPAIGETLRHDGEIVWCESGLYASPTAWGALQCARGPHLHRVWCEEIERRDSTKFVCRSRTIVASIDATDLLRDFARRCALDVIHLWDAPEVVRRYLETGDKKLRAAAREAVAARDAARYPAKDAAWYPARDAALYAVAARNAAWASASTAARASAWASAWASASDSARASARAAAQADQSARFNSMVNAAFEAQEGLNNG